MCQFSSAGCRYVVEKCLRAIESGNQLGNCFIWEIAMEENTALCQSRIVEINLYLLPIPVSFRKITDFFSAVRGFY